MRKRLVLAFVLVTLSLLVVAGAVRGYALGGQIREREGEHIFREAATLAALVDARREDDQTVDEEFLRQFVGVDTALFYSDSEGTIAVAGDSYKIGQEDGGLSSTVALEDSTVTVRQADGAVRDMWRAEIWGLVILFLLIGVVAAAIGFVISRSLSSPFQKLAIAASALGRGRADLDLPQSRVPEVRAIAEALRTSAIALKDRLERDQQFAMHASHVLRTPLTSLRLRLEEMNLDPDLSDETRASAARCMSAVDEVNVAAGDLVDLSRSSVIGGAQIPLRDLATSSAQRWSDELDKHHRRLTAAVEGDIEMTLTPGPIEQVLDLFLIDVVKHGTGDARLVFDGDARGHLRIVVHCLPAAEHSDLTTINEARSLIESLGGRLDGSRDGEWSLILPRR